MSLKLIKPDPCFQESFLAAHAEWDTPYYHGWSLHLAEGIDLQTNFKDFVTALLAEETQAQPGWSTATNRWLVEDGVFVGAGQLRHDLATDYLATRGGHIGYGIRPSARGRGLAKIILEGLLAEAQAHSMPRVMVTCLRDNVASARTIEACGGVEMDPTSQPDMRRYWIDLER